MDTPYGWIITHDLLPPDDPTAAGTIGPSTASDEDVAQLRVGKGLAFKLIDDDGIVYYHGRLLGQTVSGFEPLDDFGTPNAGCTSIEYFAEGRWRPL